MANERTDGLERLELNLHPNEASGLLTVENGRLLEAHGWDFALWEVLDEGRIEDCIAVLGHERGAGIGEGWEIEPLNATPGGVSGGNVKKTEDAEAVTRGDGFVYVFGSHFGGKGGLCSPRGGSSPAFAGPMSSTRRKGRSR